MFTRRASILILYNQDKEILLQHRTKDAPYLPNFWGFFGGGIEKDETPEEAVIREIKEELSLDIKAPFFFNSYEIKEGENKYERFIYLLPTTLTAKQLRPYQNEGDNLRFFTYKKTEKIKFNPFNKIILKEVFNFLNTLS